MKRLFLVFAFSILLPFCVIASPRITFAQSNLIRSSYYEDEEGSVQIASGETDRTEFYASFSAVNPEKIKIDRIEIIGINAAGEAYVIDKLASVPEGVSETGIIPITVPYEKGKLNDQIQIRPVARWVMASCSLKSSHPGTWSVDGEEIIKGSFEVKPGTKVTVRFAFDAEKYYIDEKEVPEDAKAFGNSVIFPSATVSRDRDFSVIIHNLVTVKHDREIAVTDVAGNPIGERVSFRSGDIIYALCEEKYQINVAGGIAEEISPLNGKCRYRVTIGENDNLSECFLGKEEREKCNISIFNSDGVRLSLESAINGRKDSKDVFYKGCEYTVKVDAGKLAETKRVVYQNDGNGKKVFLRSGESLMDSFRASSDAIKLFLAEEEGLWVTVPQQEYQYGTVEYLSDKEILVPGKSYFLPQGTVVEIKAVPYSAQYVFSKTSIAIGPDTDESMIFDGAFELRRDIRLVVPDIPHAEVEVEWASKTYKEKETFDYDGVSPLKVRVSSVEQNYECEWENCEGILENGFLSNADFADRMRSLVYLKGSVKIEIEKKFLGKNGKIKVSDDGKMISIVDAGDKDKDKNQNQIILKDGSDIDFSWSIPLAADKAWAFEISGLKGRDDRLIVLNNHSRVTMAFDEADPTIKIKALEKDIEIIEVPTFENGSVYLIARPRYASPQLPEYRIYEGKKLSYIPDYYVFDEPYVEADEGYCVDWDGKNSWNTAKPSMESLSKLKFQKAELFDPSSWKSETFTASFKVRMKGENDWTLLDTNQQWYLNPKCELRIEAKIAKEYEGRYGFSSGNVLTKLLPLAKPQNETSQEFSPYSALVKEMENKGKKPEMLLGLTEIKQEL